MGNEPAQHSTREHSAAFLGVPDGSHWEVSSSLSMGFGSSCRSEKQFTVTLGLTVTELDLYMAFVRFLCRIAGKPANSGLILHSFALVSILSRSWQIMAHGFDPTEPLDLASRPGRGSAVSQ